MSNQYFEQLNIRMARPTAVKALNDSIISGNRKGWTDFQINILGEQTYSNVCAPIAAILDYYRNQGNSFKFNWAGLEASYMRHTRFDNPLNVEAEIGSIELDYPFDKVW